MLRTGLMKKKKENLQRFPNQSRSLANRTNFEKKKKIQMLA
jgi:hypothetical protein